MPPRPDRRREPRRQVDRPRLARPTTAEPVVLAVSLPGSGRSTWLRQTLAAAGTPVASRPVPGSAGATLSVAGPDGIGPDLAALDDASEVLRSATEAAERWPGAVLIGVDDAHLVDPEVLLRWTASLEPYVRAGGLMAVTSRWRLDLPVARGRVQGWLREIGDRELAFTAAELRELGGVDLATRDRTWADLVGLRDATAGWATAAGAMARAVRRGAPRPDAFVDDLAAHLADLVLADLDPLDHPTLMVAALLRSVSTELVRDVAGGEAARRFAELRGRHPVLAPQISGTTWSALHPLAARGLRPRAQTAPPTGGDLVALAVAWHRAAGHLREAVDLLLADHRWADAVALLASSALRFAEEARHQEFLDLWEQLPRAAWERDPAATLTVALLQPGAGHAPAAFDLLFRPPLTDHDLPAGSRAVADAVQASLAPWSPDPAGSLRSAERAIHALHRVPEASLPAVAGVRARGHWHHLAELSAGRAEIVLGRWTAAARRLGVLADDATLGPLARLEQTASHARALARCGRLLQASAQAENALDRARRAGVAHHPALVDAHLAQAEVALWRNDLEAASGAAAEAGRRARRLGCATQVAAAEVARAGVALRRGQPEQALEILVSVGALPEGPAQHAVEAVRARALHRSGSIAEARRVAASLPVGPETVLARAEVGGEADDGLAAWRPDDEPASQVLAPLVLALRHHRAGGDHAWLHLAEALERAEPDGLVGPFAELPAALAVILAALPAVSPFARAAVAAARRGAALAADASLLTPTEITVLAALGSPIPLREVADRLFVSTNTLKSHLRRIYRKLGVASRTEAVAAARRLGLA